MLTGLRHKEQFVENSNLTLVIVGDSLQCLVIIWCLERLVSLAPCVCYKQC